MKVAIKRRTNSDVISERKGKNDEDSVSEGNNQLKSGEVRIGLSKNVTRNMGNYESVKIGVWMERVVKDDDRIIKKNYAEISSFLDEWIAGELEELGAYNK